MKKILMVLSILCLTAIALGATAATYNNWITSRGTFRVRKVVFGAVSASETATFVWDGSVNRIVVDITGTDADGDITISDTSGVNYVNWENKLGSGDIDYIVNAVDASANVYGGPPTSGTHTITMTDCADLTAATFYIYCDR